MDFITVIIAVAGVAFYVWATWADKKQQARRDPFASQWEKERASEEHSLKATAGFERQARHSFEYGVPDAIKGQDFYIYSQLAKPWFEKLTAKHRYDEDMLKRLRIDWLEYLNALERWPTDFFLSFETDDEKKGEEYRRDGDLLRSRARVIENGFAAAIGEDAEHELARVREKDRDCFNKWGQIAPKGKKFCIFTGELEDYDGDNDEDDGVSSIDVKLKCLDARNCIPKFAHPETRQEALDEYRRLVSDALREALEISEDVDRDVALRHIIDLSCELKDFTTADAIRPC